MGAGTDYTDRADGRDALPEALPRTLDRILADNPMETVAQGLFQFEYRTYPEIALQRRSYPLISRPGRASGRGSREAPCASSQAL
jgi:hypothetical protein